MFGEWMNDSKNVEAQNDLGITSKSEENFKLGIGQY